MMFQRATSPWTDMPTSEDEGHEQSLETVILGQEEIKSKLESLESSQDMIRRELRKILQGVHGLASGALAAQSGAGPATMMAGSPQEVSVGPGTSQVHRGSTEMVQNSPKVPRLSDDCDSVSPRSPQIRMLDDAPVKMPDDTVGSGAVMDAEPTIRKSDFFRPSCFRVKYCGFALRPGFNALASSGKRSGMRLSTAMSTTLTSENVQIIRGKTGHAQRCAIHPDSTTRFCIDFIMSAVLLVDSISVPYQLSFEPDTKAGFWYVANLVSVIAWTLDMCAGFITGYYQQGHVVLRLRPIAWRYIRTFFWFDIFTVGCDWCITFLPVVLAAESTVTADNAVILRLLRMLKLARLLRLAVALHSGRLGRLYDKMTNIIVQAGLDKQRQFFLSLVQLMSLILWMNHIGSCCWFAIQTDSVANWEKLNLPDLPNAGTAGIQEAGWDYALCFYWATTSMASGSSVMSPTTSSELVFANFYVLFGLLVGSTLISTLSAMLLDLQISNKERRDNMRQLRLYSYQQGLDVGLAMAVEKEAQKRISQKKRIAAEEVKCLRLLSPGMRSTLNYAIYKTPLKQHCFLGACHLLDSTHAFTREVCEEAVQHHTEVPGTRVFEFGRPCGGPFYIVTGELEYRIKKPEIQADHHRSSTDHAADTSPVTSIELGRFTMWSTSKEARTPEAEMIARTMTEMVGAAHKSQGTEAIVEPGQWLCELSMWLQWEHAGSLATRKPSEFISLAASRMLRAFSRFEDLRELASIYGEALCNAAQKEESQWVSDLPLRYELHQNVVLSMPMQGRQMMSMAAVKLLQKENRSGYLASWRTPIARLEEEVDEGKCDLVIRGGQVRRVVCVIELKVERYLETENGRTVRQVLVQLGKSMKAKDAKCRLLGGKVHAGELPTDAVQRLLATRLQGLQRAGLQAAELYKIDDTIVLTRDASHGDKDLRVSSLADLAPGDVIQIGASGPSWEGQQETRVITQVTCPCRGTIFNIDIDKPLRHDHDESTPVVKTAQKGSQHGTESIYVRNVFGGVLEEELPSEYVRPLNRATSVRMSVRLPFAADTWAFTEATDSDPSDYPAFLLVPGADGLDVIQEAENMSPATGGQQQESGNSSPPRRRSSSGSQHPAPQSSLEGIPCAWVEEEDFWVLSATAAGQEMVRNWVGQLHGHNARTRRSSEILQRRRSSTRSCG